MSNYLLEISIFSNNLARISHDLAKNGNYRQGENTLSCPSLGKIEEA